MSKRPHCLVIDDEPGVSGFVAEVLRSDGWEVEEVADAESAFGAAARRKFDLVFCDVMLRGMDGYEILRNFSVQQPDARFVMMTGHGSAAGALDATAIGAFDYLVKPFTVSDVLRIAGLVREQLEQRARFHITDAAIHVSNGYRSDIPLIGKSPKFVDCLKMVGRVAPTSLSVLITGESGTGKEIVANAIHRRSNRSNGPFVTVNCGAIPVELIESELFGHAKGSFTGASSERVGLWEEAQGGTIFLDEITETQPLFQVKLLRTLQENEIRRVGSNRTIRVDARVICATNRDIEEEVEAGRFRKDLMYRLNAVTIKLPPLRERVEDIPLLALHFAARSAVPGVSFAEETMQMLKKYSWPGNVRELENAVLHAVSMSDDVIYPEHLPERIRVSDIDADLNDAGLAAPYAGAYMNGEVQFLTLAEMETKYVSRVLGSTKGNKQAAARILNIDRKTLSRIISREQ